eukprot:SAG22_NODE_2788_length_2210_cov_1.794410_3_plen_116_part_00
MSVLCVLLSVATRNEKGFDTGEEPCLAAVAVLKAGYYWLVPAVLLQWLLTAAVTWEATSAIAANQPPAPSDAADAAAARERRDSGGMQSSGSAADAVAIGGDAAWREAAGEKTAI